MARIYLTFDDGPELKGGTMNVLNASHKFKIPVSYFIVGKAVFNTPEQQDTWNHLRMDPNISLCNHSYTHANEAYTDYYNEPLIVRDDIRLNQEKLGFKNKIVRMPGRNAWRLQNVNRTDIHDSILAINGVRSDGFSVMGWDIEWKEGLANAAKMLFSIRQLLEEGRTITKGHIVMLAHDRQFNSPEGMSELSSLMGNLKNTTGYELMPISQYPGI